MPDRDTGMVLGELLDEEELRAFEAEAAYRGMTPEALARRAIQQTITERTRPKTMTGVLQAFRRRE